MRDMCSAWLIECPFCGDSMLKGVGCWHNLSRVLTLGYLIFVRKALPQEGARCCVLHVVRARAGIHCVCHFCNHLRHIDVRLCNLYFCVQPLNNENNYRYAWLSSAFVYWYFSSVLFRSMILTFNSSHSISDSKLSSFFPSKHQYL